MPNRLLYAWRQDQAKKRSERLLELQTLILDVVASCGECVLEGLPQGDPDATALRIWALEKGWTFVHDDELARFIGPSP